MAGGRKSGEEKSSQECAAGPEGGMGLRGANFPCGRCECEMNGRAAQGGVDMWRLCGGVAEVGDVSGCGEIRVKNPNIN